MNQDAALSRAAQLIILRLQHGNNSLNARIGVAQLQDIVSQQSTVAWSEARGGANMETPVN